MQLFPIHTGNLMLDGGAMFGVVPKSIWNKVYPADENNMINLAMRCLLVVEGDRRILIDNGIGDKQDEKFFAHYYLILCRQPVSNRRTSPMYFSPTFTSITAEVL